MSIRKEVAKLASITDAKEFSESVNQIIDTHIKKNPNSEIRMIKSFRKELNALIEGLTLSNTKIINAENSIIFPTEFTFILPLQKAVDLAVSLTENKEEYIKMMTHQSTLPSYASKMLKEQMKDMFYTLVSGKLDEFTMIKDQPKSDDFENEEEIEEFIKNEYIQKSLDRVGFKVNIIKSNYYINPCKYDSFPLIHTLFSTGTTPNISKEERFLIALGIMIYNDLSNFNKINISTLGFSVPNPEEALEVFGQSFAYYIMDRMGIANKHRFYDNLHMFDIDILNSDLKFVEDVLDQKPSYATIG